MQSLASIDCTLHGDHCHATPATLKLFDHEYRIGSAFAYEYSMDPEDLSGILRAIRSARQNADLVVVALQVDSQASAVDSRPKPTSP